MKLTDAFAHVIKQIGIKNVFGLQGGAVVHFFDSLEKLNINVTYNHHEESAALAATAYAKATQNMGCAIVTTGPGSTNAITGLMAAWQDSVPCIFISGQARSQHTSYGKKVRQVGTQEVNICDIVKPLTKYTKFIKNKDNFIPELKKAISISNSGRRGPVWLDVALDIQWTDIKFDKKLFIKNKDLKKTTTKTSNKFRQVFRYLGQSKKPLIIAGYGVKGRLKEILFKKFIKKFNIPIVTTWSAADILGSNDKNNLGIIGMSGQRGANKAVFSSDLIICMGNHLAIPHTTTLFKNYAPNAKKIIIDIDKNELKNLNVKFNLKIHDDIRNFLIWANTKNNYSNFQWGNISKFKEMNWYEPKVKNKPNSNLFVRELTKSISVKTCIVVDGGGTALYAGFQSSIIKNGNKIICSSSISSMGTGLAETIGVSKSKNFSKLVCIIGDGSFLMNIQDLQTISQDKINVIIVLVNNNGYLAIRNTQKEFLNERYFGTHPKHNLTFPNFQKVSKAFGIKHIKLTDPKKIKKTISQLKKSKGPIICELITDENQEPLFKQGYKKIDRGLFEPQTLAEMYPYITKPIANTNN
jgi:acetolactate synthase I/II/III large subunit